MMTAAARIYHSTVAGISIAISIAKLSLEKSPAVDPAAQQRHQAVTQVAYQRCKAAQQQGAQPYR